MRNGKLGGRGVTEEEFLRIMQSLEAVAKSEWTPYNIYDPVAGDLLEAYGRMALGHISLKAF